MVLLLFGVDNLAGTVSLELLAAADATGTRRAIPGVILVPAFRPFGVVR